MQAKPANATRSAKKSYKGWEVALCVVFLLVTFGTIVLLHSKTTLNAGLIGLIGFVAGVGALLIVPLVWFLFLRATTKRPSVDELLKSPQLREAMKQYEDDARTLGLPKARSPEDEIAALDARFTQFQASDEYQRASESEKTRLAEAFAEKHAKEQIDAFDRWSRNNAERIQALRDWRILNQRQTSGMALSAEESARMQQLHDRAFNTKGQ